jgi:hypothetical protein
MYGCDHETFRAPLTIEETWGGSLDAKDFLFYWNGTTPSGEDRVMSMIRDYGLTFPVRALIGADSRTASDADGTRICGSGQEVSFTGTRLELYFIEQDGESIIPYQCFDTYYCMRGYDHPCFTGEEFKTWLHNERSCHRTLTEARREFAAHIANTPLPPPKVYVTRECTPWDPCFTDRDAGCGF